MSFGHSQRCCVALGLRTHAPCCPALPVNRITHYHPQVKQQWHIARHDSHLPMPISSMRPHANGNTGFLSRLKALINVQVSLSRSLCFFH